MRIRIRKPTAKNWKWIHIGLSATWATMLIPTILWWRNSIIWVCVMSLYANVAGHLSAAQAAHGEEHQQAS